MYLIISLFQGFISILLLVFIIAVMFGVYSYFSNDKLSECNAEPIKKIDDQDMRDNQISKKVLKNKNTEESDIFTIGTNLSETFILIEKLEKTNAESIVKRVEEQVHCDQKLEVNSENNEEMNVLKSYNRRTKRKKTRRKSSDLLT